MLHPFSGGVNSCNGLPQILSTYWLRTYALICITAHAPTQVCEQGWKHTSLRRLTNESTGQHRHLLIIAFMRDLSPFMGLRNPFQSGEKQTERQKGQRSPPMMHMPAQARRLRQRQTGSRDKGHTARLVNILQAQRSSFRHKTKATKMMQREQLLLNKAQRRSNSKSQKKKAAKPVDEALRLHTNFVIQAKPLSLKMNGI